MHSFYKVTCVPWEHWIAKTIDPMDGKKFLKCFILIYALVSNKDEQYLDNHFRILNID